MQSGRLMGGHYDSTKQRATFQNSYKADDKRYFEARKEFYLKTKVRLMIDMIFSKTVVLTYAQFLDGLFYQYLVQGWFDNDFMNALILDRQNIPGDMPPLIEIRTNPLTKNLKDTAVQFMLRENGFQFSSLDAYRPGLSDRFHIMVQSLDKYKDAKDISADNQTLRSIISDSLPHKEQVFISSWLEAMDVLTRRTPEEFVRPWERDYNKCVIEAKDKYNDRYPQILDYFESLKARYDTPEQVELLDEMIAHFEDNEIIPNRSKVFTALDRGAFDPEVILGIKAKYNDLMNKTMAIQHECGLCDEGVNPRLKIDPAAVIDELPPEVIGKLAGMKWEDFIKWLRERQDLRAGIWENSVPDLRRAVKALTGEFIRKAYADKREGFLRNELVKIFGPGISVAGINAVIDHLWGVRFYLDELASQSLVAILVQYIANIDKVAEYLEKIKAVTHITRYVVYGLYGGGSDPKVINTGGFAYTAEHAGAPIDIANAMAMITVESGDQRSMLNSIFKGDPRG